jgi:hypothetical protein
MPDQSTDKPERSDAAPYANPVHDHILANSNRLSDDDGAAIPSTTGANHAGGTDYGVGFTGSIAIEAAKAAIPNVAIRMVRIGSAPSFAAARRVLGQQQA